jgi:fructose-1,6-bisphosphatase I
MAAKRPESYDIRGLVELDPKSKKVLNTDASASGLAGAQPKITLPKFDDVCEFTGVTLSRFMSAVSRENPELRDLETLISGIQQSVKTIAKLVERGGNWGPEEQKQKQLVNVANDILKKTLAATGTVGTISAHSSQFSQQEEFPLMVSKCHPKTANFDWTKR